MKNQFVLSLLLAAGIMFAISRFQYPQPKTERSLYANEESGEHVSRTFIRQRNPFTGELPKDMRQRELAFAATLPRVSNNARSTNWQNRGPYNLGGRTRALALDVTDENIILAGQVSGGMWRSTDGGNHFVTTTQPQQLHSVTCVAQDKRSGKTNVWYYGTGEQYGIVNAAGFSSQFSGDGIFKSTDGGLSWAQLPSTVSNTPTTLYQTRDFDFVWEMVTDASNTTEDEVYAATVNGIWRSANGGTTWAAVLGLDTSITQISQYTDLAITSTGVLYATISSETPSKGIWRSTDGINWTKITPAGFSTTYRRIEIGIAPSDESQVYFIADAPATGSTNHALWHYQYLSGDGTGAGGQWQNRTANIPDDHCLGFYTFDFRKYSSQTSYDMYFVVHPTDPNLVFLGGTNIYRSFDGFSTPAYDWIGGYQCDTSQFSNYVYPNHHPDQHRLLFLPSNTNVAFSSNDGGLMKTNNIVATPVQWELMNNGYNTGQFYSCAMEPGHTNSEIIIGGLQDNGSYFTNTLDYNQDWQKVFYGDGAYCAIAHQRSNYYMSWQTGKVFKFDISDNGTINNLSRIDPTGGANYSFITPFILDPLDDNEMYLCGGRTIWRNDSLSAIPLTGNEYNSISQGWTKLNRTTTGISLNSPTYSTLDISEENTNILYLGTDRGQVYRVDSCRTNDTASLVGLVSAQFPAGAYVSCIESDRLNHNHVMVTFSNYGVRSIFYSEDAGATWADVSGNLEENPDGSGNGPSVNWAHIYNDGNNLKYYVGTSVGLFSTEQLNGSNTVWSQEGANNIGNVVINMITSRTFDGNIVVATHGNGMYSNKIFNSSAIRSPKEQDNIHCSPNPFTDRVRITWEGKNEKTVIEIFDLQGKKVARFLSQVPSVEWDGRNAQGNECAKGAYLVRINAGKKIMVSKLMKL